MESNVRQRLEKELASLREEIATIGIRLTIAQKWRASLSLIHI